MTDDFDSAAQALRPGQSSGHPQLREASAFLETGRVGLAAKSLREFLKDHPRDVNALLLMAETAARHGRNEEAEALLAQCLELAPGSVAARYSYASILLQTNKPQAARSEAGYLLKQEPRNPLFRRLAAIAFEAIEDYAASAALWDVLTQDYPDRPDCWLRYGHALRSMGSREECVTAYRKALALDPAIGGAWWSLADLKTLRFSDAEIAQMEAQLARADLPAEDRTRLLFSLGKAYADLKLYEKSFGSYAKGNALHRLGLRHDPDVLTSYVTRCKSAFTTDLFRSSAGSGCSDPDPIFIVGMARSGSTLVEQILASHSQIEGTKELSDLATISRHVQNEIARNRGIGFPEVLKTLDAAVLKELGGRYLESTRAHRKLGRRFFTDKMGPNFVHVGMLQLILPNARIVDVRRHPLACGLSNFTQIFPNGQNDAYRLADIGRLYRDYVELMAHFDRVLPGKVHRVTYESLVTEPEAEIRRLLDYIGLPFEQACLHFHRTERVVTTVSSEQVRSPLYRDALEQWRHYEPWLGPLKAALGPVLDRYPDVPAFD
jgi:tetratricopeptide (TPR) repeat protein